MVSSILIDDHALDHVAIVVTKNARAGEVWLLEANANGVVLTNWRNIRRNIGTFYSKVVLRRLKFDKTPENRTKLYEFAENVNGNDY